MSSVTEKQETATDEVRPEDLEQDFKSYGDIVWEQFSNYRLSLASLYGLAGLFVLAMTAPVLAMNVPFYMSVPEGVGPKNLQGVSFPWFAALFDQNVFESGVDIFFNFCLFAVPAILLAFWGIQKARSFESPKAFKTFRLKYFGIATIVLFVCFVVIFVADFRIPYADYTALAQLDGVNAIFPPLEYSYRDTNVEAVSLDPSWQHLLGTDREGRDVMTRMIFGTRISLTIGVVAVAIYTAIGAFLGSIGGFFGGKVDMVILRLIEVMICFPTFFLILTLRGFIKEPSIFHIMLIIGVTGWTRIARLVRGEFLRVKSEDFVQAATALGFTRGRIIFRHVLPNALGPVLVAATFGVAGAILIEASLSFLGLGPGTAPSWGQILTSGKNTNQMAMILAPGFAIFLTVSLLNLLGEGVRDALDPKLRS